MDMMGRSKCGQYEVNVRSIVSMEDHLEVVNMPELHVGVVETTIDPVSDEFGGEDDDGDGEGIRVVVGSLH